MGSLGERCVDEIPFTSKEEDTCARIACDSSGLRCTLYVERVAMSQRKEIHRRSGWLESEGSIESLGSKDSR